MSNVGVKMVKVGDILNDADLERAAEMHPDVKRIAKELIEPNLVEINRRLGQENDAMYLAYAISYALDAHARSSQS